MWCDTVKDYNWWQYLIVAFIICGLFGRFIFLTSDFLFCLFALRPKSTAMVMAGRSVHLTTLFPGQA